MPAHNPAVGPDAIAEMARGFMPARILLMRLNWGYLMRLATARRHPPRWRLPSGQMRVRQTGCFAH